MLCSNQLSYVAIDCAEPERSREARILQILGCQVKLGATGLTCAEQYLHSQSVQATVLELTWAGRPVCWPGGRSFRYYNIQPTMVTNVKQLGRRTATKLLLVLFAFVLSACVSHDRQTSPLPAVDGGAAPKKNVTIALLGATGLVGGFILDRALAQGYDIRALARTPQKLERYEGRITIVKGDALDTAAIEALLQGSHIVISALGPVKADG